MLKNFFLLTTMLFIWGCSSGPDKIHIDIDDCNYCEMKISDIRFASEIVTAKGKVFKFDDFCCMVSYIREENSGESAEKYVASYTGDGSWIRVSDAHFVCSEGIRSPMGGNTAAFSDEKSATSLAEKYKGELIKWDQLVNRVE